MTKKSLFIIPALSFLLLLTSCYPELSVQQYDELKEDLAVLNKQSAIYQEERDRAYEEIDAMVNNNKAARAYIDFMTRLISTQNSEGQLMGEFDYDTLCAAKDNLIIEAEKLGDVDIQYYISLINPENEVQTVAAYYKTLEYAIKNIKQKLNVSSSNVNNTTTESK